MKNKRSNLAANSEPSTPPALASGNGSAATDCSKCKAPMPVVLSKGEVTRLLAARGAPDQKSAGFMTASEMGKKGGSQRWKGTTKAQRKKELSRVAKLRWAARITKAGSANG